MTSSARSSHPALGLTSTATEAAVAAEWWRHGWAPVPDAPNVLAGPIRRLVTVGNGYAWIGATDHTLTIPQRVTDLLGLHGRWDWSVALGMTADRPPPPWMVETTGMWTSTGSPLALSLIGSSGPGRLLVDMGSADGCMTIEVSGMVNNSALIMRYQDRANYWRLLGSATYAGWTLQRVEGGVVTWSQSLLFSGYGDGKWTVAWSGNQFRVITPANANSSVWDCPAGPLGTVWGVTQPETSVIGAAKVLSVRWRPLSLLAASGAVAAGNDTIGSGSWSTALRTAPALGRGDLGLVMYGLNDCVSQSSARQVDGMRAIISRLLAATWQGDDSALFDFGGPWAQIWGPPISWARLVPTNWRHTGATLTTTSTPGAKFSATLEPNGGVTALRFVNPPSGGTIAVSVNGGPPTNHTITGGTGTGQHAAYTIRIPAQSGTLKVEVSVVSVVSGGSILFDGLHVELPAAEQPRIVWTNVATLPAGVPAPYNGVSAATVAARNLAVRTMITTEFAGAKIAEADIDGALAANPANFSGAFPSDAGALVAAQAVVGAALAIAQ